MLQFDPEQEQILNDHAADQMLGRNTARGMGNSQVEKKQAPHLVVSFFVGGFNYNYVRRKLFGVAVGLSIFQPE